MVLFGNEILEEGTGGTLQPELPLCVTAWDVPSASVPGNLVFQNPCVGYLRTFQVSLDT